MKNLVVLVVLIAVITSACAPQRPYYKTAEGKRKQKYYNELQFGGGNKPMMHSH